MEKEVATASEIANPEASAGLQGYKETVYNVLGDIFSWLSAHQGIALIVILIVLGIIIWLILRAKKYRRQFENEVYIKKKEIGKKDALIEEQATKLNNLQKKLADQQGVVSEALLSTISTLTGYDADQLPIFFKSLAQIGGNPLRIADSRAIATVDGPQEEGERDDSSGMNDAREGSESTADLSGKKDASEATAWGENSSSENDAKEKLAPYEVPKTIEIRQELPLTTVGKVDKKVLRKETK